MTVRRVQCPSCEGRYRRCGYGDVPCADCFGTGQWFECGRCGRAFDTYYGARECENSHDPELEAA